MKHFLFLIILASGMIECKSPNREIVDSFEKVNKSIERSNNVNSYSIDNLYLSIKMKTDRNSKYLSQADTIYKIANAAIGFLEKQKDNLRSLDSVGDKLDVASGALIKSRAADTLENLLEEVYRYSYEMLEDTAKKKSIDSVMSSVTYLRSNKKWKHDYFYQTPTIAALTILSKFQNDCKSSAVIVLSDIYQHMDK